MAWLHSGALASLVVIQQPSSLVNNSPCHQTHKLYPKLWHLFVTELSMQERYDTIEDAIFNLTCSQKLT